jgi:5-methyltetrahydrofolate--homocysteine methyltransferase
VRADYEKIRIQHRDKKGPGPLLPIAEARRLGLATDWQTYRPPAPCKPALRCCATTRWTSWSPTSMDAVLPGLGTVGPYPKILEDPVVGEARASCTPKRWKCSTRSCAEKWVVANGVFGLFRAARVNGDDIEIYSDEAQRRRDDLAQPAAAEPEADRPRQPVPRDFIAPKEAGVADWIGAFAVAVGGFDARSRSSRHSTTTTTRSCSRCSRIAWPRPSPSTCTSACGASSGATRRRKALGRRLIAEAYRGIRPAPGYPACPDHTEKRRCSTCCTAARTPACPLTESSRCCPLAVSGFYLSHPESSYFAVGKLGRDQVEDYARRKAMTVAEIEKWLAPIWTMNRRLMARSNCPVMGPSRMRLVLMLRWQSASACLRTFAALPARPPPRQLDAETMQL